MQDEKKMGRRDQDKKNGETRCKMENKLGDETRDKKMRRQDARQKKWGDQTSDKKNGEMRHKTKKIGKQDAKTKKNGETTCKI